MSSHTTHTERRSALAHVVERLEGGAGEFNPAERPTRPDSLPGRVPGAHLPVAPTATRPASGIVLDCGISRRDGYTHVLWISPAAEVVLGSDRYARLGETISSVDGATAYDWEGLDRLHVKAPGVDWDVMLDAARGAVERLSA